MIYYCNAMSVEIVMFECLRYFHGSRKTNVGTWARSYSSHRSFHQSVNSTFQAKADRVQAAGRMPSLSPGRRTGRNPS